MEPESKRAKLMIEKIQILDESTGQIIFRDEARLVFNETEEHFKDAIIIDELEDSSNELFKTSRSSQDPLNYKNGFDANIDFLENTPIHIITDQNHNELKPAKSAELETSIKNGLDSMTLVNLDTPSTNVFTFSGSTDARSNSVDTSQNYSILTQEISGPVQTTRPRLFTAIYNNNEKKQASIPKIVATAKKVSSVHSSKITVNKNQTARLMDSKQVSSHSRYVAGAEKEPSSSNEFMDHTFSIQRISASREMATCQFCGRKMLKKNIPTHIRRAHTPKEELVCLNEEQNIFTFQHLKPGQRRKRSTRAYDYSQMISTVHIDEDPSEGIEKKFVTEGQEITSGDLIQLSDRIRYGISQVSVDILHKLVDTLSKIEANTDDEVRTNARSVKSLISVYLKSGEEFKYKLKQVGEEIGEKKRLVSCLRADLKEIMAKKVQLERRIQPMVCDLQRLEDQHHNLLETLLPNSNHTSDLYMDSNESFD